MSTRYRNLDWERDDDRYGREDDDRGRYERGLYGTRGLGGGRDYEDYGYLGGAYGGGAYGRGAGSRETPDYRLGYGRESGRESGRDYGRDYTTGEYRREHTPRRGRERAGEDFIERGYERSFRHDDDRGGRDTDYGRTTSRFYGRRGEQYEREPERDDYGRGYGSFGGFGRRPRRDDDDDDDDRRERAYRARGRGDEDRSWLDRAADGVRSWFGGDEDDRREGGGRHRGRGPRNYRRSDERIRDDINDRLTENDWLDASDIDVTVSGGEVTLSGTVESRHAKRLAEDVAESVSGVTNVQNNLRVQRGWEVGMGAPAVDTSAVNAGVSTPGLGDAGTTGTAPTDPDLTTPARTTRAAGRGQS